ncbi:MAG: TetR/AcrR family transcriptional regulator [Ileibacterium sp.]|nr:TetR/AcrR family transcriptional regulator [Ileibacterium sp.]
MARRDLESIIQTTALELFREKGFESVTVLEICQKCQITKPTFYKFAASKGSLLIHYYAKLLIAHQPGWDDRDLHGSWGQCVLDTFDFYIDALTENGPELLAHLFIHNFDAGEQSIFVYRSELLQTLFDVINSAKKEGSITTPQETVPLSLALVDLLLGYAAYWSLCKGEVDVKQRFMSVLKDTLGYQELKEPVHA